MKLVGSMVVVIALFVAGALLIGQANRPLSPNGIASVQVLGQWVASERETFTMGGARYQGGRWIDITYGRPMLRGREAFGGTGAEYGKATYAGAPVWRAGANVSTRLKTEVPLVIGTTTVPAGEYSLFIELLQPTEWTFIVSGWAAAPRFDSTDGLYGAFGYTPDKDLVRTAMTVDTLPYTVEQLTWQFLDMTADSGRMAIMWDRTIASVPFRVDR